MQVSRTILQLKPRLPGLPSVNKMDGSGTAIWLQNPLLLQARHHHSVLITAATSITTTSTPRRLPLERWSNNFARLYARRMLELVAASAASMKSTTMLQEKMIATPADWVNWEKGRDWTDDMMESLGTSRIGRWGMALSRMFSLGVLATPILLLTPAAYVSTKANTYLWDYALWSIEQAGPTFIKFTQWATTRQDLFSQEFCTHFGQLRDKTRGHKWKDTEKLLKSEIGDNWRDIMDLELQPIGSGCIAQVYKGVLKEPTPHFAKGTELAVKVQHPGIWHTVCIDFYLLSKMANALEAIPYLNLDYLSIRDTVDQFCNVMLPQLDLRLESQNLTRFSRDFANDAQVQFPLPLDELTTPLVLTETFCSGRPILDFQSSDLQTRKDLAYLGLSTTLKMIFLNDFIHGDLHPGNILVSRNSRNQLMMTLLDCGLVIEFGPRQHETVVKILGAFTRRQGREAAQLMVDTSSKVQANDLDVEMFIRGIEQIIVEDAEQNFVEHIGDYITDICYLACRHKVKLEASFINAALSVEIIEGVASSLYPEIMVVSTAMPLVLKAELMHRLPLSWSQASSYLSSSKGAAS